jgi:hypothetical protein
MLDSKRRRLALGDYVYFLVQGKEDANYNTRQIVGVARVVDVVADVEHLFCQRLIAHLEFTRQGQFEPFTPYTPTNVVLSQNYSANGSLEVSSSMILGGSEVVSKENWGIIRQHHPSPGEVVDKTMTLQNKLVNGAMIPEEKFRSHAETLTDIALKLSTLNLSVGETLATMFVLLEVGDDDVNYARLVCKNG